jgi:hypothetical protein
MRQLGYAFGIAVLGSVFSARVGHLVAHQGGRPAVAQAISGGQAQWLLAGLPRASGTRRIRLCPRPRLPASTRRSCSLGRSAWPAA